MDLAPDDMSQWMQWIAGDDMQIARRDQSANEGVWPELKYVHFSREVIKYSLQETHLAYTFFTISVFFTLVLVTGLVVVINTVDTPEHMT